TTTSATMTDGTRLDAGAFSLGACFGGSGVASIWASGVGASQRSSGIIDCCDWKSMSALHDPALTLSFRDRFAQHSNLHRISETRSHLDVGAAHREQIGRN